MSDFSPARVAMEANRAQACFERAVKSADRAERSAVTASKIGKAPGGFKRAMQSWRDTQNHCTTAHVHAFNIKRMAGEHHPDFVRAMDAALQSKEEVRRAEMAADDAACEMQARGIKHPLIYDLGDKR